MVSALQAALSWPARVYSTLRANVDVFAIDPRFEPTSPPMRANRRVLLPLTYLVAIGLLLFALSRVVDIVSGLQALNLSVWAVIPLVFACGAVLIVLHELCHYFANRALGVPVRFCLVPLYGAVNPAVTFAPNQPGWKVAASSLAPQVLTLMLLIVGVASGQPMAIAYAAVNLFASVHDFCVTAAAHRAPTA